MSTATGLAHAANGHTELAAASALTRDRSRALLAALLARDDPPVAGLRDAAAQLLAAVTTSPDDGPRAPDDDAGATEEELDGEGVAAWVQFTKKWGYDAAQREAIRAEFAAVLGRT